MQLTTRRIWVAVSGIAALWALPAFAQNQAPFTIRRPPDGATVREKVRIQIPLESIPMNGYVSLYIDGEFRGALTISDEEREAVTQKALLKKDVSFFEYVWDTKAPVKDKRTGKTYRVKDGPHTIMVRLYTPRGTAGTADLKETSSVSINLQNKFDPGNVAGVRLQYKYVEGEQHHYDRTGTSTVVAGLSQNMQGSEDQELVSYNSDLLYSVEDSYPSGSAIVRNKMDSLEVRQGGSVTRYPKEQLPGSLFQEVDEFGKVTYQNKAVSFEEFAQQGVPVSATLQLPVLPDGTRAIGDQWKTEKVKIDIPGTAPDKLPEVVLDSKLEGFEWEGGLPTAKIVQTYNSSNSGGIRLKEIVFGATTVTNPAIKYTQTIYLAFDSGRLVKVERELEIVGKTTSPIAGGGAPAGMSGPGGMAGGPGMAGMMPGAGGGPGGNLASMMRSGAGQLSGANMGAMMGRAAGMRSGQGGPAGAGGAAGPGGMRGGLGRGGRSSGGADDSFSAGARGGGIRGAGAPRGPAGPGAGGGGFTGGTTGGFAGEESSQITLRSVTITELHKPEPVVKKTPSRRENSGQ